MNGQRRWRLEFILHNRHHILAFESQRVKISVLPGPCFTPSLSVYRLIQLFHGISTLPISHHKYNEWLDKVEIDMITLTNQPETRQIPSPLSLRVVGCWGVVAEAVFVENWPAEVD
eukprot:scaffold28945_cov24-Cyclotella_meneghiniana.AAC.2